MLKLFPRRGCLHPTLSMDVQHGIPAASEDVCSLLNKYFSNGHMSPFSFQRFLIEVQREADTSAATAVAVMMAYLGSSSDPHFTRELFLGYLFDTKFNFAIHTQMHHDMNLPLSQYYIFTGHNSYLTGNQLNSVCSEKPIKNALLKGVRVVELDLWPKENDVYVKHGRTWTHPVPFQKCLGAIKEAAFRKSQYPVVVTLEDHLSVHLQAKAAKIIVDTFGSQLYYPPSGGEQLKQFPSPENLKGKILISTKLPKKYLQCSGNESLHHADDETYMEVRNAESGRSRGVSESQGGSESSDQLSDQEDDLKCDESDRPLEQRHGSSLSQDYVNIIAIRQGRKGKHLVEALKVGEHAKRISLSEPQVSTVAESSPLVAIQFTHKNILRIYPKGLRIDSSNYNPFKAWSLGAQMVALNMQGHGKHLWVAQGFFRANGGCGYVKKPSFLISGDSDFHRNLLKKNASLEVKQNVKVKLCMGIGWRQQLGENSFDKASAPDFFARVGIAGVHMDKVMEKTAVEKDKWMPTWDHEFLFALRVPELAVLRIEVKQDNKAGPRFAGQICLPVSELRPGYRVVNLCDEEGNEWELVKLLLHISFPSATTRSKGKPSRYRSSCMLV